jgi:hypothetical protein
LNSFRLVLVSAALASLAGCANEDLDIESGSVGKQVTRSICPAVAVPAQTGDVTLFDPPASRDARAIDVVATLTDLRGTCNDAGNSQMLDTAVTFRIDARRERTDAARDVVIPYFVTAIRGGSQIVSKQVGQVNVHFDAGQARASATGAASASVARAAATLPEDVRKQITRKRKPEDADASIDPLADPKVRAAVAKASFEVLVGIQLTDDQLRYNTTR